MMKNKNRLEIVSVIVTVICTVATIVVTVIALRADKKIGKSTQKIEMLANRMDSAITRIEPVIWKTGKMTDSMTILLAQVSVKQGPSKQHPNAELDEGRELLNAGKYNESIAQFNKIANQGKEAYFYMAIAYARLTDENRTEKELESYRKSAEFYLKQAAQLGNAKAQQFLKEHGASW